MIETADRVVDEIRLLKNIHDALHEIESKSLIPVRNELQVLRPPYGFVLQGVWNRRHGGYGVKSSPQEVSLIVTVVPASSLRNRGVRLPAVPAVLTTPKMCAV